MTQKTKKMSIKTLLAKDEWTLPEAREVCQYWKEEGQFAFRFDSPFGTHTGLIDCIIALWELAESEYVPPVQRPEIKKRLGAIRQRAAEVSNSRIVTYTFENGLRLLLLKWLLEVLRVVLRKQV